MLKNIDNIEIKLKNKSVKLIYPHQLFYDNILLDYCDYIYIIENSIFFYKI